MEKCEWCDKPFEPRKGGGVTQLYCLEPCRRLHQRFIYELGRAEYSRHKSVLMMPGVEIQKLLRMLQAETLPTELEGGFKTCEAETCERKTYEIQKSGHLNERDHWVRVNLQVADAFHRWAIFTLYGYPS